MKLKTLYKKIIQEKIMGGDASEIIFGDIYEEYLKPIEDKIKDTDDYTSEFRKDLYEDIQLNYDNKVIKLLLKDLTDKNGYLKFDKIYSKNKKIKVESLNLFIVQIGLTFNEERDTEYTHMLTEIVDDQLISSGEINIGVDYKDSLERLKFLFRHEFQHFIQYTINYFNGKKFVRDLLKSKYDYDDINNKKHHSNVHIEYDARVTEFAYNLKDDNWNYLFIHEDGIFSYDTLGFSYYAEYFKDYDRNQIINKLTQLGVSNDHIYLFKKEFPRQLEKYLYQSKESIQTVLFLDLMDDRPLNNLCTIFNIELNMGDLIAKYDVIRLFNDNLNKEVLDETKYSNIEKTKELVLKNKYFKKYKDKFNF